MSFFTKHRVVGWYAITIWAVWLLLSSVAIAEPLDRNVYNEYNTNPSSDSPNTKETVDPPEDHPPTKNISFAGTLVKMVLALTFIIILIYGLVRLLSHNRSRHLTGPLHLLGGVHLAPGKSIQVVEVGKTILVVGVGEDVRLLNTINEDGEREELKQLFIDQQTVESSIAKAFKKWLSGLNQRDSATTETKSFQTLLSEKLNTYRATSTSSDSTSPDHPKDQQGTPL